MPKQIKYSIDSVSNFRLLAFATGEYPCTCSKCGVRFVGKRGTVQCLGCAIARSEEAVSKDQTVPVWPSTVVEGVNKIIEESLAIDRPISANDKIFEDLNADSLDKVEILLAIESHFNISISDSQAEKVETIGDIYAGVAKLLTV